MTTNKTTALIEAFQRLIYAAEFALEESKCDHVTDYLQSTIPEAKEALAAFEQQYVDERMLAKAIATYDPSLKTSIGEQPAVREMSVDEVAEIINIDIQCDLQAAKALAKLGTIRIVDEVKV